MKDPPRIDSNRWTGAPNDGGLRTTYSLALMRRLRAPWLYVVIGIICAFPLYLALWHLLWKATGSPAVRTEVSAGGVLVAIAGGVWMFVANRHSQGRWAWAVAGVTGTAMLASLTFYLSDYWIAKEQMASRHFVEGKGPPRIARRNFRLSHEARLRGAGRRHSELVLQEGLYNRLVAGDSCVILVERRGMLHRFASQVRIESSGDGTGHWMQVAANRRRCLTRR